MTYVIVEHADTGETTLHREACAHWRRAQYHHTTDSPPDNIDNLCGTCKPTQDAPQGP